MREPHPVFQPPPPDAVLHRYMKFEKFERLLNDRALWFCRVDLLGDPLEGSDTRALAIARAKYLANPPEGMTLEMLNDVFKRNERFAVESTRMMFANCWREGAEESMPMWQAYGGATGVAIQTTFAALDEALPAKFVGSYYEMGVNVGRARYVDLTSETDRVPDANNILGKVMAKSRHFSHENEVRALYWDIPKIAVITGDEEPPRGFNIPVDVHRLIEAVVISPLASADLIEAVGKACNRRGFPALRIRRSAMYSDPVR